jgi:hypothetical protein
LDRDTGEQEEPQMVDILHKVGIKSSSPDVARALNLRPVQPFDRNSSSTRNQHLGKQEVNHADID